MKINIVYVLTLIVCIISIKKLIGKEIQAKISPESIFLLFILSLPIFGRYESLAIFLLSFLFLLTKKKIVNHRLIIVYFSIILIGVLSTVNSIEVLTSYRELLIITSYFFVSITATTLVVHSRGRFLEKSFKYIIISALALSCLNLIDLIGLFEFSEYVILLQTSNHFAYYIGSVLVICSIKLYHKEDINNIYILPVIVFVVLLFSAGSRGSLVAIVATLVVFALFNRKIKTVLIMISIFIMGLINFNRLPFDIRRFLLSITNKTETYSNLERIAIWNSTIDMIKEHPLIGVGIDNWRFYYSLPQYMKSSNQYPHAHNFYLQTGSELGITGLILYIMIFVISMYYSLYVMRNSIYIIRRNHALYSMMFIIFTAIYSLFNNPLFNSKPAMLFFIVIGLNAGLYKLTRREVKYNEEEFKNFTD